MIHYVKCPVCGTENPETYHVEPGWGDVKRNYSCKCCTYFHQKSSRMTYTGIYEYAPLKYKARARELGIQMRTHGYCLSTAVS